MDIVKQLAKHGHSPDATNSGNRSKKRSSSSKDDRKAVKRRKAQPESTHTVHELKGEPVAQIRSEISEKAEVARTDLITKITRKKTHHDPGREDKKSKKRREIRSELAEGGRGLENPQQNSSTTESEPQIDTVCVTETDGMNDGMKQKYNKLEKKHTMQGATELEPTQQTNEAQQGDMPVGDREIQEERIRQGEVHGVTEEGKPSNKNTKAGKSEKRKRKSKKQNAREAASLKTSHEAATTTAEVPANGGSRPGSEGAGLDSASEEAQESMQGKAQRFICFIGNLPYTTTSASLTSHFSSISPASVRHITDKTDPTKSKGFAFLEFDHYDKMKTCLKLYHHSSFSDDKSSARRINVQLTAGGGGSKSEGRKEKLRVKNERLGGQRVRRAQTEDMQRKKEGRNGRGPASTVGVESGEQNAEKRQDAVGDGEIHPSRRPQMKL